MTDSKILDFASFRKGAATALFGPQEGKSSRLSAFAAALRSAVDGEHVKHEDILTTEALRHATVLQGFTTQATETKAEIAAEMSVLQGAQIAVDELLLGLPAAETAETKKTA